MLPVFGTLLLVAAASANCNDSQLAGIKKCYTTYLSGFNTTFGDSLPEYWTYLHDPRMSWLLRDGVNIAQPAVCKLGNDLISCVTPYRSCMDAHTYSLLGAFNGTEANDYQIDLAVTQYQCGPGYNILIQNFYCLQNCRTNHQAALDKCDANMKPDIVLHGFCKAVQINANCQEKVMANCCGHNAGVFMCNNVVQGVNSLYPDCVASGKLKCDQPINPVVKNIKNRLAKAL